VSWWGRQGAQQLLLLLLAGACGQHLLLEPLVGSGHVCIAAHHGGMAGGNVLQLPGQLVRSR
jgi:hypothetical protein